MTFTKNITDIECITISSEDCWKRIVSFTKHHMDCNYMQTPPILYKRLQVKFTNIKRCKFVYEVIGSQVIMRRFPNNMHSWYIQVIADMSGPELKVLSVDSNEKSVKATIHKDSKAVVRTLIDFTTLLSYLSYFSDLIEENNNGISLKPYTSILRHYIDLDYNVGINLILEEQERLDEIKDWVSGENLYTFVDTYKVGVITLPNAQQLYFELLENKYIYIRYFLNISNKLQYVSVCAKVNSIDIIDTYYDKRNVNVSNLQNIFEEAKSIYISVMNYIKTFKNEVEYIEDTYSMGMKSNKYTSTNKDIVHKVSYGPKRVYLKSPKEVVPRKRAQVEFQQEVRSFYRTSKNGVRTLVRGFTRYKNKPKRPGQQDTIV